MSQLLFGTAGVPHRANTKTTIDGIRCVAALGLGCMEVEFVQGVRMGEAGARLVAETAAAEGIALSAHAPYYVNFNAHEPEKIRASQERLLHTVRIGALCGVRSIVLHTAFYLGDPPEQAYDTVKKYLGEVIDRIRRENYRLLIRPEVMGKPSQFGTIDEIVRLCTELEGLAPCVDFAHWHARTGVNNTYPEFSAVLSQIGDSLGSEALDDMHIHFSGIQYGAKGERKHLNLKDSDLNYIELLRALKDHEVGGLVICECPNLEEDALLLQETYHGLAKSG